MKIHYQRWVIPGLVVLCGIAALTMIPAVHLPGAKSVSRPAAVHAIPSPGLDSLNATPPSMPEVVAKHLFVSQRKATGQHSFPDLVVKGVFIGSERSAVFSLKSKPQANLRVWFGNVNSALSQITDSRDPRQPIADFLREWNIKEIGFSGVTLTHFITGETETYAVNYAPEKKVKDDAARGYGQGIMSQEAAGQTAGAKASTGSNPAQAGQAPSGTPPVGLMADRVSEMLKRMSPDQQKQFMKLVGKNTSGADQKGGTSSKSSSQTGANTPTSKKTTTSKKTK